jgi:hypothetical protein
MGDTWYRGEGMGVVPAKAGGVSNDIGDGMYLSDQLAVAEKYAAERALTVDGRRVYKVPIGGVNLRVLDLTTDPRWQKHVSTALPGGTIESQLRSGTASQYSTHFKNFLDANKIDLESKYDAVIGFEYRLGGKQMCILYKNGQPSSLQMKLRKFFISVGFKPMPQKPAGLLRYNGKIGPGLKFVGGTVAALTISLLVRWLDAKLTEDAINRQIKKLAPEFEAAARDRKIDALRLVAGHNSAYAVIRIAVETRHVSNGDEVVADPPTVRFVSAVIKDAEENGPDGQELPRSSFPAVITTDYYKLSFQMAFSNDEIELYRAFMMEIHWLQALITLNAEKTNRNPKQDSDGQHLIMERIKLVNKLYDLAETPIYLRTGYIANIY